MERKSLNPFREMYLVFWLIRMIRRERVDLVHGLTIKCAVYGSLAARLVNNRPRVSSVAGMGYVFASRSFKAWLLRPVVRATLRLTLDGQPSRLIVQNRDDAVLFRCNKLVESDQIRLIRGSGVDLARFTPPASEPPSRPYRVLLPARLLWDKGVGELVEASRILKRRWLSVEILLAGEPDEGNPAAVSTHDLYRWQSDELIKWLGRVDDMPGLFRSVNAVALPSYYGEGLPKSLIEAGACSRPLITTDMPGCREVVTNEIDGLLIPPRNVVALADAIERLAGDLAFGRRLGEAARKKAMLAFDEKIVIGKTLAVYDELIAPDKKGSTYSYHDSV